MRRALASATASVPSISHTMRSPAGLMQMGEKGELRSISHGPAVCDADGV